MTLHTSDSTTNYGLPDGALVYEYTKEVPTETTTVTVGPFASVSEARAAIVRDLVHGRPRCRRRRAKRFAARLYASGDMAQLGTWGPVYSIQLRSGARVEADARVRREVGEQVRRRDADARRASGLVMVDPKALLSVMAERVPAHLRGRERHAYVQALADIPIHLPDAIVEHDPATGRLVRERMYVDVDVARVLGSPRDRTGVWREDGGS